jgi:glutamate carboxypeptidase
MLHTNCLRLIQIPSECDTVRTNYNRPERSLVPLFSEPLIPMRALFAGASRKESAIIQLIGELVMAESPSDTPAAVNACMELAAAKAKSLGARVKLHKPAKGINFGVALEARFGRRARSASSAGPLLLLGHLDTVWPLGTLKAMPYRVADGRIWGPGTLDMKGGVAMALTAIEMLTEAGALNREIVLLLNPDEEVGSPLSRPITERVAAECAAVFVLEPAQGLAYKTARKGTGDWRIDIKGIAAHAGVDFKKGASAIRELAHVVETVSDWTELKRGLTVSPGVAGGGSKTNVIPAEAWVEVDVRIARKADGPRMERKFAALKARDPRCTLTMTGGINRPPMERTRGTVRLFNKAKALAAELGIALEEAATGGASDGNLTSALGIPTLDGMGAVGEGAHAAHESIVIEHLAPRTALLAGMLMEEC